MPDRDKPLITLPRWALATGALALLAIAGGLLAWRIWSARIRLEAVSPADGARNVSSRIANRVPFRAGVDHAAAEAAFEIDPPAAGWFAWEAETLVYRPSYGLLPGQTYTVTAAATAADEARRWQFHIGQPRLVYIAPDEAGRYQLYAHGSPPARLSTGQGDVWDYAVHPEGARVVYSVETEGQGADLWVVERDGENARRLLHCPEAMCTAPSWSYDGRYIAYERQDLSSGPIGVGSGPVVPQIWLLEPDSGATMPLHESSPSPGRGPSWSPAGERLAFYDLSELAVQVYDLASEETQFFDTLGGTGSWDPLGERLVIADVRFGNEGETDQLFLVSFATRKVAVLHAPGATSDALPRWSPNELWIAFGRTALADGTPTAGTQLWLIHPDGGDARALVTDPEAILGAFAWRPDGGEIAYVRLRLEEIAEPHPELWVASVPGGERRRIAIEAILPGWLP